MALVIFIVTFLGVALTRLPWVKLDRPAAAFLGAVAMVLCGVLTPVEAVGAIDWDTLALLLGMMIIIAGLQQDGYTQAAAAAVLGRARSPRQLLALVIVFTGVVSAFLVNDAVVLVLTPMLIAYCRARELNPVPFLLAEAMASNIGGVATMTGNPQNTLIGLQSGISYVGFLLRLLPLALLASIVLLVLTSLLYRKDLRQPFRGDGEEQYPNSRPLKRIKPSGIILALVVLGFLLSRWIDVAMPLIALAGAGLVLAFNRTSPSAISEEVFRYVLPHGVGKDLCLCVP
jgi:Na+/H+ antiporter NhaD/arsenite permease-like protein